MNSLMKPELKSYLTSELSTRRGDAFTPTRLPISFRAVPLKYTPKLTMTALRSARLVPGEMVNGHEVLPSPLLMKLAGHIWQS